MKNKVRGKILILIAILCFSTPNIYSQKNVNSNGNSKKIIDFFPDTSLAILVGQKLNRDINDKVTIQQLANIHGGFEVGPGGTKGLKGIGYLTGVESLSCCKNEVPEIPAEIGKMKNLVWLDLAKAFELKSIPREIGNLKKLKYLNIGLTELDSLPDEIGELENLDTLYLGNNQIKTIPKSIGKLKNLKLLDISSNNIETIPNEICNLASLRKLFITHNKLKFLPADIGNLKNLQTLNLNNNDLRALPKSISQLANLTYLNVYDNYKLNEEYKKYLPQSLKQQK